MRYSYFVSYQYHITIRESRQPPSTGFGNCEIFRNKLIYSMKDVSGLQAYLSKAMIESNKFKLGSNITLIIIILHWIKLPKKVDVDEGVPDNFKNLLVNKG